MKNKTFILGIDGGSLEIILDQIACGKMPHTENLVKNGCFSHLISAIPPTTAPAWASFICGMRPESHNIFDFHQRVSYSYEPQFPMVSSKSIPFPALWDFASLEGLKSIILGLPLTYPPPEIDGILVSGLLTPQSEAGASFPPHIKMEIEDLFGKFKLYADWESYTEGKEDYLASSLISFFEYKAKVYQYLLKKYEWDLAIVVFSETDQAQHFLWRFIDPTHPGYAGDGLRKYGEVIFELYRLIDSFIGELFSSIDIDNFLLISDHGAGPLKKKFYINRWLELNGYLTRCRVPFSNDSANFFNLDESKLKISIIKDNKWWDKPEFENTSINGKLAKALLLRGEFEVEMEIISKEELSGKRLLLACGVPGKYWAEDKNVNIIGQLKLIENKSEKTIFYQKFCPSKDESSRRWMEYSALLSRPAKLVFSTKLGEGGDDYWSCLALALGLVLESSFSSEILFSNGLSVDMNRTLAFAGSDTEMGIFLNYGDKPERKINTANEYKRLGLEIIDKLERLKDNGKPIFDKVKFRSEVYSNSGKYSHNAPDLILFPHQFEIIPYPDFKDELLEISVIRSGTHRPEGVFIFCGKGCAKGKMAFNPSITDLAPTILYLLGLSIPKYIEGNFIYGAFDFNHLAKNPPVYKEIKPEKYSLKINDRIYTEEQAKEVKKKLEGMGYI